MRALDRKLLRDAWHYRGQLSAIVSVVTCGIALFVTLRSMHGYLRGSRDDFYVRYRFADLFAPLKRAPLSVSRDLAVLPGVAQVSARVVKEATIDVPGLDEPAIGRLVSVSVPREPMLNEPHVLSGRWPLESEPDGILASAAFAGANGLAPGDSLGAVLHGRWRWLRITGTAISPEYVYEMGGGSVFPDNRRFGVLWMSHDVLTEVFDLEGAFNDLTVQVRPGTPPQDLIAMIDRELEPYGGVGAYGREDQLSHLFLDGEIEETQVTSIILPAIFLGVTAFLLHIVLSRLVGTQREQIATLKAYGYSMSDVATHYLALSLIPVAIGSLLGTVLGLWLAGELAVVYSRFFQFPPAAFQPDWTVVGTAILVGAAAGVAGALSAVVRSASLAPAEAMRPEAPPRFHGGLLEHFRAFRRLAPPSQIIVRNLERRPGKAGISVIGLGLAGGLVVTVMSMFDAVDFMKDIQFHEVMREDVTVTFESPRPAAAAAEVARLPGVLLVEPVRVVPVRFHAGARENPASILGLPDESVLRRVADGDGRPLNPPTHGVLLSSVLARTLRVRAGDIITARVLEGARPERHILVAGVTDELVGSSAYMETAALNRLAGSGEAISGALVIVDHRERDSLYAALKRMPAVGGVSVREVQLRSFEETIAESFSISLIVMLGFAVVIAFGIVYNSARVALSERGRELASLRVLGFTRAEVTTMLLGEQAVLMVASMPLGLGIAYGLSWLISVRFESDLFRIPVLIEASSALFGVVVVAVAGGLSALAVRGRIANLDLVEVLKTRE
jgi:putative ABC transport system permease protein